ncbi:MAG: YlxR family protein [Anaerolineae bacterium]|nr:YlxR family protein [Anaerolineae bacterium]
MSKSRHKPQRTCIACRQVKDKRELIRVVRTPAGKIIIDPTGKANGRGAYLCRDSDCYKKALNKEWLARSLTVSLSPIDMAELQAALESELSKV